MSRSHLCLIKTDETTLRAIRGDSLCGPNGQFFHALSVVNSYAGYTSDGFKAEKHVSEGFPYIFNRALNDSTGPRQVIGRYLGTYDPVADERRFPDKYTKYGKVFCEMPGARQPQVLVALKESAFEGHYSNYPTAIYSRGDLSQQMLLLLDLLPINKAPQLAMDFANAVSAFSDMLNRDPRDSIRVGNEDDGVRLLKITPSDGQPFRIWTLGHDIDVNYIDPAEARYTELALVG